MATDIYTRELRQPVDVAEYLFRRLHEVGIRSVHGVPGRFHICLYLAFGYVADWSMPVGDYNLSALDYIEMCGLNWVGNCNELNAGYAADGYARIKGTTALLLFYHCQGFPN